MVKALFPEFGNQMILVALGSKTRVRRIQTALQEADRQDQLNRKLYSIVDKDLEDGRLPGNLWGMFQCDAYKIENFLLEPKYIRMVFQRRITHQVSTLTEQQITEDLTNVARTLAGDMVENLMERHVRDG